MKQKLYTGLAAVLALLLILAFGKVLTIYTKPMADISLDLSLSTEDGAEMVAPEDFDSKGWTVYTQKGDEKTALTPDGFGAYFGCEPGETLYYSRLLSEELDSPTLKISTVNRKFSVWLDEQLLYTDCPELDNRIGYVTLPMNEWDRLESITISLPMDYQGKTLTIGQSTPEYSDVTTFSVIPASVMLYCGYAYESELIAESFQTAFLAGIMFVIGFALLIAMVRNLDLSLLLLALIPFCEMIECLTDTSFFYTYFGTMGNSALSGSTLIIGGIILLFLAVRSGKYRRLILSFSAACVLSIMIHHVLLLRYETFDLANTVTNVLLYRLPSLLGLLLLLGILVLSIVFWRKENYFYKVFSYLAPAAVLIYWIVLYIQDPQNLPTHVTTAFASYDMTYLYYRFLWPITAATIFTAIIDSIQAEVTHRMENQLLEERRVLTLESYENLRRQHEEIMMIRHDMMKHFHTLNDLSSEVQVKAYLEEIIGQNQTVRPIVQTGNQMFDIILNGKLSSAVDAGLRVDIVKASVPAKLPVSDADLCSLMMNIMDNAISAASSASVKAPFIRIDIHEKNDYLAIVCENSADCKKSRKKAKKETVPKHGWGLKIVNVIVKRYHGIFENSLENDFYRIRVLVPLA